MPSKQQQQQQHGIDIWVSWKFNDNHVYHNSDHTYHQMMVVDQVDGASTEESTS